MLFIASFNNGKMYLHFASCFVFVTHTDFICILFFTTKGNWLLRPNGYLLSRHWNVLPTVIPWPSPPPSQAWVLVAALSMVGAAIVSTHFGPLITALYVFGLFLGTIYSVPPLRLKRFAVPPRESPSARGP